MGPTVEVGPRIWGHQSWGAWAGVRRDDLISIIISASGAAVGGRVAVPEAAHLQRDRALAVVPGDGEAPLDRRRVVGGATIVVDPRDKLQPLPGRLPHPLHAGAAEGDTRALSGVWAWGKGLGEGLQLVESGGGLQTPGGPCASSARAPASPSAASAWDGCGRHPGRGWSSSQVSTRMVATSTTRRRSRGAKPSPFTCLKA